MMAVAEQASRRFHRFVFYIGAAYDDLTAVFVIDGRDYPDSETASADRAAASDALSKAHIIAEVENETIVARSPRLSLPSWPEWRDRELPDGKPRPTLPVFSPQTPETSLPETVAAAESAGLKLRDELLTIAAEAVPSGHVTVSRESAVRRRGPARIGAVGETYGCDATVSIRHRAEDGGTTMAAVADSLSRSGWTVGGLEHYDSDLVLPAERGGDSVTAIYTARSGALKLVGKTRSFEVVAKQTRGSDGD
ncbi:hypothetical protein [Nocardia nova]|nr:hypothetical protein [Nocardia nova]